MTARNRVQGGAEQVVVQYEGDPGQVDALSSIIREERPPDADVEHITFETHEEYSVSIGEYMHMLTIDLLSMIAPL